MAIFATHSYNQLCIVIVIICIAIPYCKGFNVYIAFLARVGMHCAQGALFHCKLRCDAEHFGLCCSGTDFLHISHQLCS